MMKTMNRCRLLMIGAGLSLALSLAQATDYPAWWIDRDVIDTGASTNDYAALNQGQLKNMATNAYAELEAYLPGGAGEDIETLIGTFTDANNYYGANLGQLKYVASNFWYRLIEEGVETAYPWTETTDDDQDFAAANLGQLKAVFNWEVSEDTDNDGLPDWWEMHYFGSLANTEAGDSDGDGMTNVWEYEEGANPTNTNTDGGAMGDYAEALYGFNPKTNDTYTALPFTETFEALNDGDINGQNDWHNSEAGKALVQTNEVYAGNKALAFVPFTFDVKVYHYIGAFGTNTVWTDLYMRPVLREIPDPPAIDEKSSVLFYVNEDGYLTACDGGSWTTLTHPVISESDWIHLTIEQDYSSQTWSLWLSNTNVAEDLSFATNTMTEFSRFMMIGGNAVTGYLDNVTISASILDSDADGLPDWWEVEHFGSTTAGVASEDTDNDGLTNAEEYAQGTDPNDSDDDDDWMGDGTEVAYGYSPTTSNAHYYIPFAENFEQENNVLTGNLHGQRGWQSTYPSLAEVQTTTVYQAEQALKLHAESEGHIAPYEGVEASHELGGNGADILTCEFFMKPVHRQEDFGPNIGDRTAAAFYIYSNAEVVVYDGANGWTNLAGNVSEGDWHEFDLELDYTNQTWSLTIDGTNFGATLGFATNVTTEFSKIAIRGGTHSDAYVDQISITSTNLDEDMDNLPDWWETAHFGGATNAIPSEDSDSDGALNSDEYANGTDPNDADEDDDGMGDAAELRHGFDPSVSNAFDTLPFIDDFEDLDPRDINGQNNWIASVEDMAVLQNSVVTNGTQACRMTASSDSVNLSHYFGATGEQVVYSEFYIRSVRRTTPGTPTLSDPLSAAFYLDWMGRLVVWTNDWQTLTSHPVVPHREWMHLVVRTDYAADTWQIWLDGSSVGSNLAFDASSLTEFSRFQLTGSTEANGYLDDVRFAADAPGDMDADGLDDAWEVAVFGDLNETATGDFDSDGINNLLEYQKGSSASTNDTDGDGLFDYEEVYTNFTDWAVADSDGDGVNDYTEATDGDPNTNPTVADTNMNGGAISIIVTKPESGDRILW